MEEQRSRCEPRIWVIGVTLPVSVVTAALLGALGAPTLPVQQTGRVTDLALTLLVGLLLAFSCSVIVVAIHFWRKAQTPRGAHFELIDSLPSPDEDPEDHPSP